MTLPPYSPVAERTCVRCDKPASGRYCDQHRREHAQHLRGQIEGVLADHQRNRDAARTDAVARMTCGHGSDAVTLDGRYFICGACELDEKQSASTAHSQSGETP